MLSIKFRGKETEDNEWVYGYYIVQPTTMGNQTHIIYDGEYEHTVDPATVGQYTGLKDKNGKEIYEGDMVQFLDAYMYGESGDWDECSCIGEIKWDNEMAQFYVTNRESMDNEDFWEQIDEFEVIGNRWDTPEGRDET